jgi:hypothetical protein
VDPPLALMIIFLTVCLFCFVLIEKDILMLNKIIEQFTTKAAQLGARQIPTSEQSLTSSIEEDIRKRLVDHAPSGVIVKDMLSK